MPGEKCDRCGSVGSDRRSLWMRCLYAMEELGIPFDRKLVLIADGAAAFELTREPTRVPLGDGRSLALDAGEVRCDGKLYPERVYTLRVCKRCRGEWLAAIRDWFRATPEGEDHDADERPESAVGSGIFVRENGAIREISEEEWAARSPGRGPVRARRDVP